MRLFACPSCQAVLYFDNTACLACGAEVAYLRTAGTMVALVDDSYTDDDGEVWRRCRSAIVGCNWLCPEHDDNDGQCFSCSLTRQRQSIGDQNVFDYMVDTSHAKRWLIFQLDELGLPIVSYHQKPDGGLAFDLAASTDDKKVMIGHLNGVITIDLTEAQDSHREALRSLLGEQYRTMLGHFRHEIGHYYWQALIDSTEWLDGFRELFGDERRDYGAALDTHYGDGPAQDWRGEYISQYATTHPWEDFAETFAHYLHITDTLQSAGSYGLSMTGPSGPWPVAVTRALVAHPAVAQAEDATMADILSQWLPLAASFNLVNQSMGKDDLYPFVIPQPVTKKLDYIHQLVVHHANAQP